MRSCAWTAIGLACVLGGGALAQQGRPEPVTAPTDPLAAPGDYMDIPQEAQLKVPLGPQPGGGRQGPPRQAPDTTRSPGYALALKAALKAMDMCKGEGFNVTVAVTDAVGRPKVLLGADGTRANGVFMALRKDVTVVGFGQTTLQVRQRIEKDPSVMGQVKPNMVLLPGGVPILKDGTLVGAMAVSGASAYQEETCAKAGIAAIQAELR